MNKKGYFYSLDAFIALLLILGVILFIKPQISQVLYESEVHEDVLKALSNIEIGEINNSYAKGLISAGKVKDLNNSVLDQIGEFYANSSSEANSLAQDILDKLNLSENIGIYFNNKLIAISNTTGLDEAQSVVATRQIISGIQNGTSAKGFSSRAFLYAENKVKYYYFGGYVGDGNITVRVEGDVVGAFVEGVFSSSFELFVNGISQGSHIPAANIPYNITINSSNFVDGVNNISFRSGTNLYIAGGYMRIAYAETQALVSQSKKFFPGIEGLINIYDSFYVPGTLNNMEVFLHFNSSYDIFMTIGDEEIYKGNSSGAETTVTLNNANLSSVLNYNDLSNETIPYRLGLHNVSHVINLSLDSDVISVTDLSGSMRPTCKNYNSGCCSNFNCDNNQVLCEGCGGVFNNWWGITWCSGENAACCSNYACVYNETSCTSCGGTFEDKMQEAQDANKVFIDAVLNSSGNRVGLVGYRQTVSDEDVHELSNDSVSLKVQVDAWSEGGNTCICCGINRAVDEIVADSSPDKLQSMVVMSDGQANQECARQGVTGDLDGDGSPDTAKDDAIKAACDAYINHNITIHSVGFGADADQTTLQLMTAVDCGHGSYYYGDVDDLTDIYEQIAQHIINASYYEQTIVGEGFFTKLYPDSYIEIDYERNIPFGMLIVSETNVFGNNISQGSFFIPNKTTVYEVQAISYSGSKWTSLVEINNTGSWTTVFNLSEYNSSYIGLGDPYAVNIPSDLVKEGDNEVKVRMGLGEDSIDGGSKYNKIIYSILKNVSSYSPIRPVVNGCVWNIEFEDGSIKQIDVPENYTGTDDCYYNSTISDSSHANFDENDAIEYAIYLLLNSLDLNDNGKIETKFTEQDLSLTSIEIEGIPFTWETEVQSRVWM